MSETASGPAARLVSPALLRLLDEARDPVRFVEIGANDGVSFDPIAGFVRDRGWSGLMVEPVPHVYERLVANHGENPRLRLINAAVAAEDGTGTIHHLRPGADDPGLPPWSEQIASFDRAHVLAELSGVAEPERLLASTEVEVIAFETLLDRHGGERLDLLLIDAEGADLEIVEATDLDRLRPRLLVYEHHHMGDGERRRCESRLAESGYELVAEGLDTWALDTAVADELSVRWRRVLADAGRR